MAKIAILSDTHDNVPHLMAALQQVDEAGAEVLLHLGDLCAPFMLDRMAQGFRGPVHVVFGNNDGDGRLLATVAARHSHVTLHGIYAEVEVAGARVALIHYPEPALRIAQSGQLDLVCYGHNHKKHAEQIGSCWLVNPGEVLGLMHPATWGIYDTDARTFEHVQITA